MVTKKDREELLAKRKKALYNMFCRYPKGITMKDILVEQPKLFNDKLQARNVMSMLRRADSTITFRRQGSAGVYVQRGVTYKLLNKLWLIRA